MGNVGTEENEEGRPENSGLGGSIEKAAEPRAGQPQRAFEDMRGFRCAYRKGDGIPTHLNPSTLVNTSQHLSTDTGKTAYLVGGGHEMGMKTGCGDWRDR